MPSAWKRLGRPGRKVCLGGVCWGLGLQSTMSESEQRSRWERPRTANGRFAPADRPGASSAETPPPSDALGEAESPPDGEASGNGARSGRDQEPTVVVVVDRRGLRVRRPIA